MITLDKRLEHWIVAQRTGWLDWLSIDLSRIGSGGLVWLVLALVLAIVWRRPWVFAHVLLVDAVADLLATLGKDLIPRHRPFVHQLGSPTRTHSFPSGHSATAFACATVLAWYLPRWRIPLFALATLIALSRLYNGDHFPLDVLAGSALGVLTALLLREAIRRAPRRARRAS